MDNKELIIAFGKGRGFEKCCSHFNFINDSQFLDSFLQSSLPFYKDKANNRTFIKARQVDLPWLLRQKHVDIAVGSSVWFNHHSDKYRSYPLHESTLIPCRLSIISNTPLKIRDGLTVATKYVQKTKAYFKAKGFQVNIIELKGCHENALMLNFVDAIVDIIETGNTIKKLKLIEIETLEQVEHRAYIRNDGNHDFIYKQFIKHKLFQVEDISNY